MIGLWFWRAAELSVAIAAFSHPLIGASPTVLGRHGHGERTALQASIALRGAIAPPIPDSFAFHRASDVGVTALRLDLAGRSGAS